MNDNFCGNINEASEGVELDAGRYDVGGGLEMLSSLPRDCLDQSDIALHRIIIMRYNNIVYPLIECACLFSYLIIN